jgi:hypothetical protein
MTSRQCKLRPPSVAAPPPQVFVGGLPCPVTSVSAREVTCTVPRQYGLVRAEYWALPWAVVPAGLPDFDTLGAPGG